MKKKATILRWLATAVCGWLAACAIITVNVYFPEKDVKQAYKSLDEMLLQKGEGNKPAEEQPPGEQPAAPGEKKEEVKPQSRLEMPRFDLSLVGVAQAQEKNIADDLAVEMSSMPEVLNAYHEIKARIPQLNALRDSGAVGEGKQGLLKILDKKKLGGNEALVNTVNDNRKIVITGMAKAILKLNKQPETKAALNQVMAKAAATFASLRQDEAKPGWWIELANGRWVQK